MPARLLMVTEPRTESLLRMLWVDGTAAEPPNALARAFSKHCHIEQAQIGRIRWDALPSSWDAICFDFDYTSLAGLARVAKARARWPRAPIILLTKRCSCALALWGLRLGVFDLLTKPLAPEDIALSIRRLRDTLAAEDGQAPLRTLGALREPLAGVRPGRSLPPVDRLKRAKDYIELHYNRPLPQSEVALVCEMSTSWFSREFKNAFGANFLDYLTHQRMEHAKRLLCEPAQSVATVATAVGFTDPAYFTRVFRRTVGMCPTHYRDSFASVADHTPANPDPAPALSPRALEQFAI